MPEASAAPGVPSRSHPEAAVAADVASTPARGHLEAEPAGLREGVLKKRVFRGSIIELGGYGANQGLRLVTNLILSRLLFPEAYGLTAIVTVFMVALGMLTDVGLRDSIIYHRRGDDPRFLNTVWTMQVIRGVGLWMVAALLAYPVSRMYDEPALLPLIVVAGFALVVSGFGSTSVHTLSRQVRRGPLVVIEILSKVISMTVMFVWAWVSPTVWALVAGGIVASLVEMIGSHLLSGVVGYRNRFWWDKDAARTVTSFGKWIFGSSAFTFLAGEGDRLLLGHYLSMAVLGVYSVACLLTSAVGNGVQRLVYSVFYGFLSQVAREERSDLRRHYYAARLRLDILAMPILGALMVLGPAVVGVLYDERYHDAGWMMQVLCVRVALACAVAPAGVCLVSMGQPRFHLFANGGRFLVVWTGIPIGWHVGGLEGIVWATTLSEIPIIIVFWRAMASLGVLRLRRELVTPLTLAGGAAIGWLLDLMLSDYLQELTSA